MGIALLFIVAANYGYPAMIAQIGQPVIRSEYYILKLLKT